MSFPTEDVSVFTQESQYSVSPERNGKALNIKTGKTIGINMRMQGQNVISSTSSGSWSQNGWTTTPQHHLRPDAAGEAWVQRETLPSLPEGGVKLLLSAKPTEVPPATKLPNDLNELHWSGCKTKLQLLACAQLGGYSCIFHLQAVTTTVRDAPSPDTGGWGDRQKGKHWWERITAPDTSQTQQSLSKRQVWPVLQLRARLFLEHIPLLGLLNPHLLSCTWTGRRISPGH